MSTRKLTERRVRSRRQPQHAVIEHKKAALEADLSRVLRSIASILIESGYPYSQLSKIARAAFVSSAATSLRRLHKKASIARVAASTGLTRSEVSMLLRRTAGTSQPARNSRNRFQRIATAWQSDKQFLDAKSRPRPLKFRDGARSFTSLVKSNGGDIPARAMLLEMLRLGMVTKDAQNVVRLVSPAVQITKRSAAAMRAVAPWVDLLGDSIRNEPHGTLSSNTHQVSLQFDSIPQVRAVLRALRERRTAFVQGLPNLGAQDSNRSNYTLRVTVAVAVTRPVRASKNNEPNS